MGRLARSAWIAVVVVVVACSRGSAKDAGAPVLAPAPSAPASPVESVLVSPPVFSAPIAATRAGGQLVVAGLIAAEGTVRLMALGPAGAVWSADVLRGVGWQSDAELHVRAAGDGFAVVWRGLYEGKSGSTLVVVGPRGEARGEPIPFGAASCATAEGAAWVDPHPTGPVRVRSRRWAEPPRDSARLAADRAPTLVCGDRTAVLLGEGDDDITAAAFAPGETAQPAGIALRNADFGDEEERDHFAYTSGDDVGLVRVGASGGIATRDLVHDADGGVRPAPWRHLHRKLEEEDDVVAVDGDAAQVLVVYTRDAGEACGEAMASGVHAVRVDRKSGDDAAVELAAPDCARMAGAFWIESEPGALVAAWTERPARPAPGAAPIAALAYRVFADDGAPATTARLDLAAEAVAGAGCDASGCYAATLVRPPDNDGGRPEPVRVVRFAGR